jgi:hypothetical protein
MQAIRAAIRAALGRRFCANREAGRGRKPRMRKTSFLKKEAKNVSSKGSRQVTQSRVLQ